MQQASAETQRANQAPRRDSLLIGRDVGRIPLNHFEAIPFGDRMRVAQWVLSVSVLLTAACGGKQDAQVPLIPFSFNDLPQDYIYGLSELPDSVQRLSGHRVEITGFLCANQGEGALFSYYEVRGCVPRIPDVEGTVRLTLDRHVSLLAYGQRARVRGVFTVGATLQDGFCLDVYQMRVESLEFVP